VIAVTHVRCYEVLGLRPGATAEQIHLAYKRLALQHHPDRSLGSPHGHGLFCEVTEAYAQLRNTLAVRVHRGEIGFCPKCEQRAELFLGMDRRRYCAPCLLYRRRKLLPPPTYRKVRCLTAVGMQGLALYATVTSQLTGEWLAGMASVLFAVAAMAALACNFLTADVIEV